MLFRSDKIARAAAKGGHGNAVTIVAVTKTHGPDAVLAALENGLTNIGENKVQEAQAKIPMSPSNLIWHFVGHLQRNKVKIAVQLFDMIHSVDSLRLLQTLDQACDAAGKSMPVLLEVNVSGEGSKYGLKPDEVEGVLEQAKGFSRLDVMGLMTIPPFTPEAEKARGHFAALRELRDS